MPWGMAWSFGTATSTPRQSGFVRVDSGAGELYSDPGQGPKLRGGCFENNLEQALQLRPLQAVAFYWQHLKDRFLASWEARAGSYLAGIHLVLLDEMPGLKWLES